MMAYANPGYVVSIIQNQKPIREQQRTVLLDENSEYAIRLTNKTGSRCLVYLELDGMPVRPALVLLPHQSTDLDCFPDTKKKFKFVSRTHPNIQDPTTSDLGKLKATFYQEQHTLLSGVFSDPLVIRNSSSVDGMQFTACVNSAAIGGTVEGGNSSQNFAHASYFPVFPMGTVIEMRLMLRTQPETTHHKFPTIIYDGSGKPRLSFGGAVISEGGCFPA